MQIWTFLHILAMFAAVTIIVGSEWWANYAVHRRDVGALRAYFRVAPTAEKVGQGLFLAGIVFGVATALVIGWDLLARWLVATYVLIVLIIVLGSAGTRHLKRVEAALPESGDGAISPQLQLLLDSRLPLVAAVLGAIALAGVIALMVFKPTL